MASKRHAPEASYDAHSATTEFAPYDPYGPTDVSGLSAAYGQGEAYAPASVSAPALDDTAAFAPVEAYGPPGPETGEAWDEWNPTEDSVRSVRGRHRVGKQRSGGMARSGAVLGVGMIAAVGAGGMATAKDKGASSISMPDLASAADSVKDIPASLPDTDELPGIGGLMASGSDADDSVVAAAPLTGAGVTEADAAAGQTDAGEALRARIVAQAESQQSQADNEAREAAAAEAADKARAEAAQKAAAEREAEAERKAKIEEEKRRKAEAERLAKLARSFTAPVSNFQLTSGFGDSGGMWQSNHTGQDFASPTGTPVKAVHTGTIKEAGWAGSFGYRIVLELDDGTELWFCHLSSMTKSAGEKVNTGDVIGRVGSTGNSSGPHLHVEVRPGGSDTAVDPLAWMRGKGINV